MGIEFEEIEFVVFVWVEVFDGISRNVFYKVIKMDCCFFYSMEGISMCDSNGGFFDNFLVVFLDGIVMVK